MERDFEKDMMELDAAIKSNAERDNTFTLSVLQRVKQIILEQREKLEVYEDIGLTPDLIEELKAKQKPKKAVWKKGFFGGYSCPNCKEIFTAKKSPYCSVCGQAIDWEN